MPKIQYVSKNFGAKAQATIAAANKIITEYEAQGYELTLRQLYYQFVSRDLIANTMREYKNLGNIINDARLNGNICWHAITDRTRNLAGNSHWNNPAEIVEAAVDSYRIDMWNNQPTRVEVWVEKDALSGIVDQVARKQDVDYFSCRGYTSQSEMWVAAQRIIRYNRKGQKVIILHLGDHDPSGKDMTRDIIDRLRLFGAEVEVDRIALNMDQVRKYNPPPNPAKVTDSRAKEYMKEFGTKSWELDALEPKVLSKLIESNIKQYIDADLWSERLTLQKKGKKALQEAAEEMDV